MKQRIVLLVSGFCIAFMILHPEIAVQGAKDGIGLCIQSVIPSLFPFIFLTTLIASRCDLISLPFLRTIGKWVGVPYGSESILLLGWLGGYPIGAKCVYENYKNGLLTKGTAARMVGFCNNAGPSFIFGVLFRAFSRPVLLWILWLIQILSSFLSGVLLPGKEKSSKAKPSGNRISIPKALQSSIQALASICGWIILFRVAFSYLDLPLFSHLHSSSSTLMTGLLELTNGCFSLTTIPNEIVRFLICNIMLTFGGFCVAMQTKSVVKELGLRMYFPGKLIQCFISFCLSLIVAWLFF